MHEYQVYEEVYMANKYQTYRYIHMHSCEHCITSLLCCRSPKLLGDNKFLMVINLPLSQDWSAQLRRYVLRYQLWYQKQCHLSEALDSSLWLNSRGNWFLCCHRPRQEHCLRTSHIQPESSEYRLQGLLWLYCPLDL